MNTGPLLPHKYIGIYHQNRIYLYSIQWSRSMGHRSIHLVRNFLRVVQNLRKILGARNMIHRNCRDLGKIPGN